jgi:hypothetical protein
VVQDPGDERFALGTETGGALATRKLVDAVAPDADVNMGAVSYRARDDSRREARAPAVTPGDRTDDLPHENRLVARAQRISRSKRELHLAVRVLGVDLFRQQAGFGQGISEIEHERPRVGERRRPVAGPSVNWYEDPGLLPPE